MGHATWRTTRTAAMATRSWNNRTFQRYSSNPVRWCCGHVSSPISDSRMTASVTVSCGKRRAKDIGDDGHAGLKDVNSARRTVMVKEDLKAATGPGRQYGEARHRRTRQGSTTSSRRSSTEGDYAGGLPAGEQSLVVAASVLPVGVLSSTQRVAPGPTSRLHRRHQPTTPDDKRASTAMPPTPAFLILNPQTASPGTCLRPRRGLTPAHLGGPPSHSLDASGCWFRVRVERGRSTRPPPP